MRIYYELSSAVVHKLIACRATISKREDGRAACDRKYTRHGRKCSKAPPRVQQSPSITLAAFYSVLSTYTPTATSNATAPAIERWREQRRENTRDKAEQKLRQSCSLHNALKKPYATQVWEELGKKKKKEKREEKKKREMEGKKKKHRTLHQHSTTRRVTREEEKKRRMLLEAETRNQPFIAIYLSICSCSSSRTSRDATPLYSGRNFFLLFFFLSRARQ